MNIKKNEMRARAIQKNGEKEKRRSRNTRVKDYIEMKMLKGYSRIEATYMAKQLIDNQ